MKKQTTITYLKILLFAFCICAFSAATFSLKASAAVDLTFTIDTGASVTLKDADGDGYYDIGTADELYAFSVAVNSGNKSINGELTANVVINQNVLTADGELNGNGSNFRPWTQIGYYSSASDYVPYAGSFNGNGYTISGLYFNNNEISTVGLFGYVLDLGKITNVGVIDNYINGSHYVGGIVGDNYGTVTNCYNMGTIKGDTKSDGKIGGVVGENDGTVENCYNTGNVSSVNNSVGGVVGGNLGTITNCYNTGNISSTAGYVGGVAGTTTTSLSKMLNCYNTGNVSGENSIGGVVGSLINGSTVQNCYNVGTVRGASNYVGGVIGKIYKDKTVINCYYLNECAKDGNNVTQFGVGNETQGSVTWDIASQITSKTNKQFSSGEVCTGVGYHIGSNTANGFCDICSYIPANLNANGYYEIANAGQLFWFANHINTVDRTANAVLTADIDLENKPWTPIGFTDENSHNFRGVFDGQNHTIKGLYVEGGRAGLGFFGEVRTGTVKNFTIYGEVVVNTEVNYVGGVIGSACGLNGENNLERNGATIQNITSYVNLTAKKHGVGMIGGFVGYANHESLIENCSWFGTFDAGIYRVDSGAGGFIGKIQENSSKVTIRNCGAYGTIKTNYAKNSYNSESIIYMGGFLSFSNTKAQTVLENCLFAGKFERGANLTDKAELAAFGTLTSVKSIKNCYYLGDDGLAAVHSGSTIKPEHENIEIINVTNEQLLSGEIAYKLGEAFGQTLTGENRQSYPVLGGETVYYGYAYCNATEMTYANSPLAETTGVHSYDNGFCINCDTYESATDLDSDGYYEIDNAGKLYWFAAQVVGGNTAINGKLTANIVVNENVLAADGTLNGDGSNFRAWTPIANGKYSNQYAGSFDGNGFTVSGLYFNDNETNYVGLFGSVSGGTVKNVGVVDSYISGKNYVGGVVGYSMNGTVESSYNTSTVESSEDYVGGVVGYFMNGTVKDSYNTGTVTGSRYVGGVIGENYGTVTDCYNTGSVSGNGSYVGGVMGENSNTVTNCYNTGNVVSNSSRIGGVMGYNDYSGTVTNCYNTGSVSGNSVGGVIGENSGTVTNCYNTGSVSGNSVGGVIGENRGTVTNCYNTGNVVSSNRVGDVVYYNYTTGTVTNCYYLADSETDNFDGTTYKKADQFASGEVAYLLQNNPTEQVWGQNIGTDAYPVLGGSIVYMNRIGGCTEATYIYEYSNTQKDATTTHAWNEGVITTNPTCSTIGTKTFTCTHNSEHTKTEDVAIDEDAHVWNEGVVTTNPTCSTIGTKTFTCTHNSEHTKTEDVAIDEDAHVWNEGVVTTNPTCSTVGTKTFTCTHNSEHTKTEDVAIDEDAHTWNEGVVTTNPTCSTVGTKTFTCTHNSEHTKTEDVAIDEDAHVWNEGVITTNPTCSTVGTKTFTCTHNSEHTKTEDVAIDEDAHDYGDWVITENPTATQKGSKTKTCACGHSITEEIPPTGEKPSGSSKGCGSAIDGTAVCAFALLFAVTAIILNKKRKEDQSV